MQRPLRECLLAVAVALSGATCAAVAQDSTINPPPQAADWAALAKLPDWSGVWTPNMSDQDARIKGDPIPWNPAAAAQIAKLVAAENAGDPKGLFVNCLPESMPSWMLITHNALEFLFTPGRVTILGESDGNRLRRIYTDGRPHPPDPDPTFHGHSIGHWKGRRWWSTPSQSFPKRTLPRVKRWVCLTTATCTWLSESTWSDRIHCATIWRSPRLTC